MSGAGVGSAEWISGQAYRTAGYLVDTVQPTKKFFPSAESRKIREELCFKVFGETLPFDIACFINCLRGKHRYNDKQTLDTHQFLYKGFIEMEWSQVDTWEYVPIRFGKGNSKALKEITTAQNTHELVYSYLRADKSASGLDEKLLTILAGVLQVKDLSDLANARLMISMARILVALGVMKPGNIVDMDFFKVTATWMIHTSATTDFLDRTAKGLDES